MKRVVIIFAIATCAAWPMQSAHASAAPATIQIVAVSPGSASNSRQEFIELYNASAEIINFDDGGTWEVQLASSTAHDWKTPLRTIHLKGYVYPGRHYVIGSTYSQTDGGVSQTVTYPDDADASYSSALSATAGHIRIIYAPSTTITADNTSVLDEVEYGGASTVSLDARQLMRLSKDVPAGTTLSRRYGTDATAYSDTDNDGLDFSQTTNAALTTTAGQPELPVAPQTTQPTDDGSDVPTDSEKAYVGLVLTELLPNPAPPALDATDEFIEVYNATDASIDLTGYALQSGLTSLKTFHFAAGDTILAHEYRAFYAKETKLTLSNSGGKVSLLAPDGSVLGQTDAYGTAKDGMAWQLYDGAWQWSSKPTPNTANEYVSVPLASATKKATASTETAKVAKVKSTTTKTKKAATPKKKKATKAVSTVKTAFIAAEPKSFVHTSILAVVLTGAVLYGIYEYRHDLADKFRKRRSDRTTRPSDRAPPSGE